MDGAMLADKENFCAPCQVGPPAVQPPAPPLHLPGRASCTPAGTCRPAPLADPPPPHHHHTHTHTRLNLQENYYRTTTGAASCVPCPRGTEAQGTGNTECVKCTVGYYNNREGECMHVLLCAQHPPHAFLLAWRMTLCSNTKAVAGSGSSSASAWGRSTRPAVPRAAAAACPPASPPTDRPVPPALLCFRAGDPCAAAPAGTFVNTAGAYIPSSW